MGQRSTTASPLLAAQRSPLSAVLAFTFLNSLGSAVLTNGLFFLAKTRFGFDEFGLFALGVVWGVMYIPGALAVGPILRRLPRTGPLSNHRAFLGFLMIGLAASTLIAVLGTYLAAPADPSPEPDGSVPGSWTIWVLVIIYSPLSGMLWPVVESYVSGGRSGQILRNAIGRFNITWSSSLVVSTVCMAPFVAKAPLGVLAALGVVHLLCLFNLRWFQPRPGVHGEDHEPHPPVYVGLLSFCRVALPLAFMFVAALAPYLPKAADNLGIGTAWGVGLAAVWLGARVSSFIVLERWDGWHGRWWLPLVGLGVLLLGFTTLVVSPLTLPPGTALPLFVVGLALFGAGVGVIYSASLYYAMSVGSAEVDAGGMHETLIGVGYTAGPLCGLISVVLTQRGVAADWPPGALMLGLTSLLAAGFTAWALKRALAIGRARRSSDRLSVGPTHDAGPSAFVHPRR